MDTRSRKIAFLPEFDGNQYIARMQGLLSAFGVVEKPMGIKKAVLHLLAAWTRPYDIVWLNFTENEIINATGGISVAKTLKLFLRTAVMTALSRQSVFVRHNHFPHATSAKSARLAKTIVDLYEKLFDTVVTLSGAEAGGKKIYCPHPLYKLESSDAELPFALPPEFYLVFGKIVPYKKIENLIPFFPKNKALVVAGSSSDKAYTDMLSGLKEENFFFYPGRLAEAQVQTLLQKCKAVVISHADKDMIVSGTFFYAMTMAKPVFAVETDFFRWIQQRLPSGCLYLAQDISKLGNVIEATVLEDIDFSKQDIQAEFGDELILNTVRKIFM